MKNDYFSIKTLLLIACVGLSICACSNEDDLDYSKVKVEVQKPDDVSGIKYSSMNITFTDTSTKEITTMDYLALQKNGYQTRLVSGLYDIMIEGEATADVEGVNKKFKVRGALQAVEITADGKMKPLSIPLQIFNVGSGFVFAELFVSGTLTPEGEYYSGDSYFRLYNNTNKTMDAQGLAILQSAMQSDIHDDYYVLDKEKKAKDIELGEGTAYDQYKKDFFITDAIYMIPRGKEVLVKPGESILLVDVAKDHSADNANSFNLQVADYEWYDENDIHSDIQTEVPDLVKLYGSSKTIWVPHQRGIKAYAIARIPEEVTIEKFASENVVNYYHQFVYGDYKIIMTSKEYEIPVSWIHDCVNLSNETAYKWNEISPVLDKSYAWSYNGSKGSAFKGRAVRRKVFNGKILVDTNDSANDFEHSVKANPFYKFHE